MRGGHAIENRVLDFRIAVGVVETLVEFWHLSIADLGLVGSGVYSSLGGLGQRRYAALVCSFSVLENETQDFVQKTHHAKTRISYTFSAVRSQANWEIHHSSDPWPRDIKLSPGRKRV